MRKSLLEKSLTSGLNFIKSTLSRLQIDPCFMAQLSEEKIIVFVCLFVVWFESKLVPTFWWMFGWAVFSFFAKKKLYDNIFLLSYIDRHTSVARKIVIYSKMLNLCACNYVLLNWRAFMTHSNLFIFTMKWSQLTLFIDYSCKKPWKSSIFRSFPLEIIAMLVARWMKTVNRLQCSVGKRSSWIETIEISAWLTDSYFS